METPDQRTSTERVFGPMLDSAAAKYEQAGQHLSMVSELSKNAPHESHENLSRAILNALEVHRVIDRKHRNLRTALLRLADEVNIPHAVIADVLGVPESLIDKHFVTLGIAKSPTPD